MASKGSLVLAALAALGCDEPAPRAAPAELPAIAIAAPVGVGPPPPPSPTGPLRVLVAGDLLPHRPSLVSPSAIREALAPLRSLFATADSVVANYEASTGDVDEKSPRLIYAAPPGWLGALSLAGLHAVTVANNHACDLGAPGLGATLEGAEEAGLTALGADAQDPWAPRVLVERGGKRVCAVAWTTLVNSQSACARSSRLAVAHVTRAGRSRVDRALARARSRCDATIAIFHGGVEYVPQTTEVMDFAAHAAEAGADAVVIHHPHVASPVTVHTAKDGRKVPLFASIGNLVTNQGESYKPSMFPVLRENRRLVCVNGWTRLGVIADLAFRFDGEAPALDWGVHLTWIDNEHADDRSVAVPRIRARLLDPTADKAVVDRLSEDPVGPDELFSEPCWVEKPGDPARCHLELRRPDAAPSAVAVRARKKRLP